MGKVGRLKISHLLGSGYGDSSRLIIGVLRCWDARSLEKHSERCSHGASGQTLLVPAWELGHSLPGGPFPGFFPMGPHLLTLLSFPIGPRGKLSPLGLGGVALGDRLCGLLASSLGPRGKVLAPSISAWL